MTTMTRPMAVLTGVGRRVVDATVGRLRRYLDDQYARDAFVRRELSQLPAGSLVLDAGAGEQPYRAYCSQFRYRAQDVGSYRRDLKPGFADGLGDRKHDDGRAGYRYGPMDYVGDIWRIDEKDGYFDAIICTEVLEHIPYPIDAVRELARLLKTGGVLLLTAPGNSLRHMDPLYFYAGFSDRFYEHVLTESALEIEVLERVGDYYRWLCVEMARTAKNHGIVAKLAVLPAFIYYLLKRPSERSANSLCIGYLVRARKR